MPRALTPEEWNQECIRRLRELPLEDYVGVVGSGPSCPYIAGIGSLTDSLLDRCRIDAIDGEQFWDFCERAYDSNEREYFEVLRETYENTPHWDSRIYRHLLEMPFKAYITFNYDDQLPRAFRNQQGKGRFTVFPSPPNDYYNPVELCTGARRLIAIHGYSDPSNPNWPNQLILRLGDYNKYYTEPPLTLHQWWKGMLLLRPCIFVGTSLQEPGLQKVVDALLADDETHERMVKLKHTHLLPLEKGVAVGHKSLSVIQRVHFDKIDERYTGLINILSEISGYQDERPEPIKLPVLPIPKGSRTPFFDS
jgi:hypothetical protein